MDQFALLLQVPEQKNFHLIISAGKVKKKDKESRFFFSMGNKCAIGLGVLYDLKNGLRKSLVKTYLKSTTL